MAGGGTGFSRVDGSCGMALIITDRPLFPSDSGALQILGDHFLLYAHRIPEKSVKTMGTAKQHPLFPLDGRSLMLLPTGQQASCAAETARVRTKNSGTLFSPQS
ncbi:hypothetical protein AA14337_0543 [Acetobacter malorum DSM 14337]|uniref:Uncharacterized protein n=1 Tax=Acetobacter malorum DSM 14337 TaxID=1307910 RepID=A0ABQ0PNC9_9PROT|nr:hypothetical protein AA14337_0543 [Acetobacter malorum DSM 14337]